MQTTCNINDTFDLGTAHKCTVQWWFRKFCKGQESLDDEEYRGWPSEVDNNNWEQSSKLILLQLCEKLPKNSASSILWSLGIWSFSYSMQQQQTISWSDCDLQWKVDFIWHPVTTNSVAGQRRSSKALPKAKLAPK